MKRYDSDLRAAQEFERRELGNFPRLTKDQLSAIRRRTKEYARWHRQHPRLHNLINGVLMTSLFGIGIWSAVALPAILPWSIDEGSGLILGALVCGAIFGFTGHSLGTMSVHAGAAHDLAIIGNGPVARTMAFVANNVCRLFFQDPTYYRDKHRSHHLYLGTERDGAFTNFVRPFRLLLSLLPGSIFIGLPAFRPWLPPGFTRGRLVSMALTTVFFGTVASISYARFGLWFTVLNVFGFTPLIGYGLDRLRESSEHSFMPLDADNGTRDLGVGFWGLLLGGGPWGQPCHLSHHLAPGLPWYQQLRVHWLLHRTLTPAQKKVFFIEPFIGFPVLAWRFVAKGLYYQFVAQFVAQFEAGKPFTAGRER